MRWYTDGNRSAALLRDGEPEPGAAEPQWGEAAGVEELEEQALTQHMARGEPEVTSLLSCACHACTMYAPCMHHVCTMYAS